MAYKIIAAKSFFIKVIALNKYLETEWGSAVASDFHESLVRIILTISQQPGIGSFSRKKKNVRKILITKHNRLYYRVNDNKSITLLILFDTRQHPKRNRYD